MRAQLLEIEIHAGIFLRVWARLGDGEGESATPGDVHDGEGEISSPRSGREVQPLKK